MENTIHAMAESADDVIDVIRGRLEVELHGGWMGDGREVVEAELVTQRAMVDVTAQDTIPVREGGAF